MGFVPERLGSLLLVWDVGPFADRAESKEMFAQLQASGYVRYDDLPLKSKSGAEIPVEFVSNSYDCEGIKVIQCNIRNITEQKRAESERAQLASIAESSSAGNPPEIPGGTDRDAVHAAPSRWPASSSSTTKQQTCTRFATRGAITVTTPRRKQFDLAAHMMPRKEHANQTL